MTSTAVDDNNNFTRAASNSVKQLPVKAENSATETGASIVATIMGGGIVSIPFAYAVAGIPIGLSIQAFVVVSLFVSTQLYMKARSMLKCNTILEQITDTCICPGASVLVNLVIAIAVLGICTMYLILFSDVAISLLVPQTTELMTPEEIAQIEGSFLNQKAFYVIALSLFIAPIVIKESLAELKMNTYIIFGGVASLTVILAGLLISNGSYEYRLDNGLVTETEVSQDTTDDISMLEKIMDSVNIAVASQGFIINFFPIYSAMKKSERPKIMYSVLGGLTFTMVTYTILGLLSLSYFGTSNIQTSILVNMQGEADGITIFIELIFLLIFFCNIPFVFFAGKGSLFGAIKIMFYQKKGDPLSDDDEDQFQAVETAMPEIPLGSVVNSAINGSSRPRTQGYGGSRSLWSDMSAPINEKDMIILPFWVQALVTYGFLALIATLSICIDDLTLVFGIIAGLAESGAVFILPSILYLLASRIEAKRLAEEQSSANAPLLEDDAKHQRRSQSKAKSGGPLTKAAIWAFMLVGATYFSLSNYFNVLKIMRA